MKVESDGKKLRRHMPNFEARVRLLRRGREESIDGGEGGREIVRARISGTQMRRHARGSRRERASERDHGVKEEALLHRGSRRGLSTSSLEASSCVRALST